MSGPSRREVSPVRERILEKNIIVGVVIAWLYPSLLKIFFSRKKVSGVVISKWWFQGPPFDTS